MVLVALALIAYLVYRDFMHQGARMAEGTGKVLTEAAASFWSGNVTESFVSGLPELDPNGSGNLELATFKNTETLTRKDEIRVLWDVFSLGTTESEIRVPVTYRYHLRLSDEWNVRIVGSTCIVQAPAIRASQPPSIHTDGMEKRVDADWLRFDAEDQLATLERSLTPTLVRMANDERHREMIREPARRAVVDFVRDWLLREQQWDVEKVHTILVVFPDEDPSELPVIPELLLPSG